MVTIRASERGLIQIDRARRKLGWLKQSEIWCRMAHTSRATLKRFWRQEQIDRGSFIAICQAVGITDWEAISHSDPNPHNIHLCLSEMPDVPVFFGRMAELAQLTEWAKQCRLIAFWGMGGIGKTSLVAEWVESISRASGSTHQFEAIFWQSLQYDLSLESFTIGQSEAFADRHLLTTLQKHRCLLILDNWERVIDTRSVGSERSDLTTFSQFFQQLATTRHNSCTIVICQEKPPELFRLEGNNPLVRSYRLEGLAASDAIELLTYRGLKPEPTAWGNLIQLYRGNPLALNTIASTIEEMFQGSTAAFLKLNTIVTYQLDNVIAERIRCLNALEIDVLKCLATARKPITREWLQLQLDSISQSQLIEILFCLERRCLLEIRSDDTVLFGLAPIVQKYVDRNL